MTRMAGDDQVAKVLARVGEVLTAPASTDDEVFQAMIAQSEVMHEPGQRARTVPNGPDWWERNAAIPGNTWILPNQAAQHRVGSRAELEWQYPFFRQDLVDAGLLSPQAPQGSPKTLTLPDGMSVLQAIEAGVIR